MPLIQSQSYLIYGVFIPQFYKKSYNSPRFFFQIYPTYGWYIIFKDFCTKRVSNLNEKIMRNILYLIAVILIIGWLLGVFAYSAGGLIHILLVLAVVSIILSLIRRGV